MVITRTPFRVSFFGGGTDYPAWYRKNGGAVLATTINRYCYLSCRHLPPFFSQKHRVVYSKIENVNEIDEITHPAAREVLRYMEIEGGVSIHHEGDLPARSGLGSSSAYTVGLLHALYALKGKMVSSADLAKEAIYIERERLREVVGSQDQVLAAYGGLNLIRFLPNDTFQVRPLAVSADRIAELNAHLMLFYTGVSRIASTIAESYVQDLGRKEQQMQDLGAMVDEAMSILTGGQALARFGKLLHEGWKLKRSLGEKISNPEVEKIYEAALSAGALGGKLIGAGGGGFMLLFVHPQDQVRILEQFRNLVHVPFQFDFEGSQIIFYDPDKSRPFPKTA